MDFVPFVLPSSLLAYTLEESKSQEYYFYLFIYQRVQAWNFFCLSIFVCLRDHELFKVKHTEITAKKLTLFFFFLTFQRKTSLPTQIWRCGTSSPRSMQKATTWRSTAKPSLSSELIFNGSRVVLDMGPDCRAACVQLMGPVVQMVVHAKSIGCKTSPAWK